MGEPATRGRGKKVEHLSFIDVTTHSTITKHYYVVSNRDPRGVALGGIKWYAPWRRYCFFPTEDKLFDAGCLETITSKINELMNEWRSQR